MPRVARRRDNTVSRGFAFTARVSERYGTPSGALTVITVVAAIIALVWAVAFSASAFDIFVGTGTIGTLIILGAYLMLTVGAIKFLFFSGRARVPMWEIVIPVAAVIVLGYVVFRNVWPVPPSDQPAFWYSAATIVWLLIALVFVYAVPGLAGRVGDRLRSDEGLAAAKS